MSDFATTTDRDPMTSETSENSSEPSVPDRDEIDALRGRFERAGQGHVFRHFDELDPAAAAAFAAQLREVDLDLIAGLVSGDLTIDEEHGVLGPAPVLGLGDEPEQCSVEEARARGEELLRAGKVGVFLVAGGQGSRLGFSGPKGCFPCGPLSGRTLFELHAAKIRRMEQKYDTSLPWYIMTSQANNAATREFFEANDFFGLDPAGVRFLPQAMLPAVDGAGKLVLADRDSLFLSPNGHGGAYQAFAEGGLEHARAHGIEHIFYFQVDNALIRIPDPFFMGVHAASGADISLKVLTKTGPMEKIGVVALRDGHPAVVEYSDLSDEEAHRTDDAGHLVFGAGSIAIHAFRVDFMASVADGSCRLPYHVAEKELDGIDADGEACTIDGRKFETFVFDAVPFAQRWLNVEVVREQEFAPIKNRTGVDSADSSSELVLAEHRRWLEKVGVTPTGAVEISPLAAVDWRDLAEDDGLWRREVFPDPARLERGPDGEIHVASGAVDPAD